MKYLSCNVKTKIKFPKNKIHKIISYDWFNNLIKKNAVTNGNSEHILMFNFLALKNNRSKK